MDNRKVVIVTGCSKNGIGYSLCEEFAKNNCRVFATARRVEAMEGLEALGIEKLHLDVCDRKSIDKAVKTVIEQAGRIDILVNNAGVLKVGPIIEMPLEEIKSIYDANVFGVISVIQAVVPFMAKQGSGKIVNVGSVAGILNYPFGGGYNSSKAALHSLSDILRLELKPLNIDVMVIAPGAVATSIAKNASDNQGYELSSDSPYSTIRNAIQKAIVQRINISQEGTKTTSEAFAKNIARQILRKNSLYIFAGDNSLLGYIVGYFFPRWLLDLYFLRLFGLWGLKRRN
ncbi:uncharacterized protein VTP21DRAFT_1437 [Calcarisporiella thermophila]|uniref:uncharacterized protein n=1 Tax=Calcarisporiella thermophila TaxID=911321 RepID=UPI003742D409